MADGTGEYQEESLDLIDNNKNTVLFAKRDPIPGDQNGGDQYCIKAMDSTGLSLGLDTRADIQGAAEGAQSSPENSLNYEYSNGAIPCATRAVNKCVDYNCTPINSPQTDDSYMSCASRFNQPDGNGHPIEGMRPEAHPYLDWDELFALTDYVQMGCQSRRETLKNEVSVPNFTPPLDTLAVPVIHNGHQNGEISDESSITSRSSSDLFDVFINPVHHSTSDETDNDEITSTDSNSGSSASLCSETDSDTTSSTSSRPHKSSLRDPKKAKTPPGTPTKKSVRFADALGLDLETVRHILEQDPCPSPPVPQFRIDGHSQRIFRPILRLCFDQPGGRPDFLTRIYEQNVCLENVVVSDMTVMGTIKVRNLDFQKEVRVRYSWDAWNSHANILAMYVAGSCDGPTDRFTFGFTVPRRYTGLGDQIFLAVYYRVGGHTYWDNNGGYNYLLLIEEEVKMIKGIR